MSVDPNAAKAFFMAALDKSDPAERAAYLAQACGGDDVLRQRVEILLKAHHDPDSFLVARDAPTGMTIDQPPTESAGTVIGAYKLLEQIGEGGMGTVWMAQQTEPVKRVVALKLIKAGMDSRQVIARFEAERQALALMDHPNIAKVLDAGTTSPSVVERSPDRSTAGWYGRPYFVMELVKGVKITQYCDEHRLTPRQRLELFIPVCQAVQHAHQKGIIHRDLKPSNVLVALYDGKPVPKVIDFGVAKAAGQPLTEQTLVTGFGAIVGTLEYMSPEQAEVNQLDIDTRSDIYSLGVLLYELLTGTTPLEHRRVRESGLLEALRIIREEEVPTLSNRLSLTAELRAIAANRSTEPAKLTRMVRGELDWIVMKALEKDRSRRYETANSFAMDVHRYLADEPVLACPPSMRYRLGKLVRRHRSKLTIAGLVVLCVGILSAGTVWTWQDRTAREARATSDMLVALERAEMLAAQGNRPEAMAAFERAQALAGQVSAHAPVHERMAALQERLDADLRDTNFVRRFYQIRLEEQSLVDEEESHFAQERAFPSLKQAFEDYGIDLGVTPPHAVAARIHSRPGDVQRELLAAVYECWLVVPLEDSAAFEWLNAVLDAADTDRWRSQMRLARGNAAEWVRLLRDPEADRQPPNLLHWVIQALKTAAPTKRVEYCRRLQALAPGDFWANHGLAFALAEAGAPAEAVRYYTAALALRPNNPGVLLNRGNALKAAGELEAALTDYRRAIAVSHGYAAAHRALAAALNARGDVTGSIVQFRRATELDPKFAPGHFNLGVALMESDDLDGAIAAFRQAIALRSGYVAAHVNLGGALLKKGDVDAAVNVLRRALELDQKSFKALHNLGSALLVKKDVQGAIVALRRAVALQPDAKNYTALGSALRLDGDLDGAVAACRQAIVFDREYATAHFELGQALSDKKDADAAIAAYREALAIDPGHADAHNSLGCLLLDKNDIDPAISAFRQAIAARPTNAFAHNNLGTALHQQGKLEEAVASFQRAIALNRDYAEAYANLGRSLREQGKFAEALAAMKKAHELGSRSPTWRHPTGKWVALFERLVQLEKRLPAVLDGTEQPASTEERLEFARVCQYKRLHAAAARLYQAAFAAGPKQLDVTYFRAICAAALAGCGKGQDADQVDADGRTRWRQQALDWLRADLDQRQRLLNDGSPRGREIVQNWLTSWKSHADLADLRQPLALEALPQSEREAWQAFWRDVDRVLEKARMMEKGQ